MKGVGTVATVLFGLMALGGAFLVIKSIPDIRRYMKISNM
jgi:hypothetical protein